MYSCWCEPFYPHRSFQLVPWLFSVLWKYLVSQNGVLRSMMTHFLMITVPYGLDGNFFSDKVNYHLPFCFNSIKILVHCCLLPGTPCPCKLVFWGFSWYTRAGFGERKSCMYGCIVFFKQKPYNVLFPNMHLAFHMAYDKE